MCLLPSLHTYTVYIHSLWRHHITFSIFRGAVILQIKMKSKWNIHLGAAHRAALDCPFLSFLADLPVCLQACVSVFFGSCQPVRPKVVSSSLAPYLLHFWHLPDIKGKTKACTHTALARSLKSYTVFYCTEQKKMHILNIRQDTEVCRLFVFNLSEYAA